MFGLASVNLLVVVLCVCVCYFAVVSEAFRVPSTRTAGFRNTIVTRGAVATRIRSARRLHATTSGDSSSTTGPVPPNIASLKPLNDMILIERIDTHAAATGKSGLQLSASSYEDQKLVGKVIAVADPSSDKSPVSSIKAGDMVMVKDGWGVGPKNIEVGNRKFSFHDIHNVVGVITEN
jgi:co-chaperonin GroES (HSP10)